MRKRTLGLLDAADDNRMGLHMLSQTHMRVRMSTRFVRSNSFCDSSEHDGLLDRYDSWLLPGMLGVLCEVEMNDYGLVRHLTVDWDHSRCWVDANDLVPLRAAQVEVTGCAISCVNGSYIECETERNGRKCFSKADGNGSICFDGECWKLRRNSYSGLFDGRGDEEGSDLRWTFSQLPFSDSSLPPPVWGIGEHADLELSVLGGVVSDRLLGLSAEIRERSPGGTIGDAIAQKKTAQRMATSAKIEAVMLSIAVDRPLIASPTLSIALRMYSIISIFNPLLSFITPCISPHCDLFPAILFIS
jgi:hypothetical protein